MDRPSSLPGYQNFESYQADGFKMLKTKAPLAFSLSKTASPTTKLKYHHADSKKQS
jgi:hypothetical protein